MITGGIDCSFPILGLKRPSLDITEVVDLSTKTSHISGNLKTPRQNHGMSVMKIGNAFKLIAFGGESEEDNGLLDSIEVWDSQNETWNKSEHKLEDKVSRFSTTTAFCGLSPEYFGHQANNFLEDNQSQNIQSTIPLVFPKTEKEGLKWFRYCIIICQVWSALILALAIFPHSFWMVVMVLVSTDLFIHSGYYLGSNSQKLCLIKTSIVPTIRNHLQQVPVLKPHHTLLLISWAYFIYYDICIPITSRPNVSEKEIVELKKQGLTVRDTPEYLKVLEHCMYHCDQRKELSLYATLLMIILSYDKIATILCYFHKRCTQESCIEQMAKRLTHPRLTLTYIFILLCLEYHTGILLHLWITYITFIVITPTDGNVLKDYLFTLFISSATVLSAIFWSSPLPTISWLMIFPSFLCFEIFLTA